MEIKWKKYEDLEPIKRLLHDGREMLGQTVSISEKRDGENVSLWIVEDGIEGIVTTLNNQQTIRHKIASHNMKDADDDIKKRLMETKEFSSVLELLQEEKFKYGHDYIVYGELIKKGASPTRIEPVHKHSHWVLFDIWDATNGKWLEYTQVYQFAFHARAPIVKEIDRFIPKNMDELMAKRDAMLKWCRRHKREGVIFKVYSRPEEYKCLNCLYIGKTKPCERCRSEKTVSLGSQVFAKEKIDIPKREKLKIPKKEEIQLPPMPPDRILRALQHSYDELINSFLTESNTPEQLWKNKALAMPIIVKHFNVEGREHNFAPPKNPFQIYMDANLSTIRGPHEAD
jgi:hypothetical protein